jgi:peroxiredoxin
MKNNKDQYPLRFQELESQFRSLENQIQDSAIKNAISVLHGMLQESMRYASKKSLSSINPTTTIKDVANMYKQAPKMEGEASNSHPLPVGTHAPDFALPDSTGKQISLSDFKGKNVLLVFYPLDWSPGCSQQLDLYQNELVEFKKRGVEIIGISVDSVYSHGAWAAVRGIDFPLLADFHPKGLVAKKYQVYREEDGFTERALYLIDDKGIITHNHISPFIHHVPDIYDLYKRIDELKNEPKTSLVS